MPLNDGKPSCEQLIDILPGPFMVIDADYRIRAANQAYLKQYGVAADELIGRRCHEVSHRSKEPCSRHGEQCPLEMIRRTREPTQVTHVHYDGQNRQQYVQLHAAPILSQGGEVLYIGEYVQPMDSPIDTRSILIGNSPSMLELLGTLQRVAPSQATVLLLGESGVGKEAITRYIHHHSRRRQAPLVVVDCGRLDHGVIESELFGHEKGAFTGATQRKIGLIEAAHGGTLFLDEIGELPLNMQAKLLRFLENGTIRRIGGNDYQTVDTRIVAATHRDLKAMIASGTFREDLYYRLAAFPINVPPLRQHKEDIPALATHLLCQIEEGSRYLPLSTDVLIRLFQYEYPGNVRELRNVLERAVILAGPGALRPQHIQFINERGNSLAEPPEATDPPTLTPAAGADAHSPAHGGAVVADQQILEVLRACGGHRARAAVELGICERSLYRRLQRIHQSTTVRESRSAADMYP